LENLRCSVDNINSRLGGFKKLDLFESARVDPSIPIEEAVRNMARLVKEGKFEHIGLSECSAATVRRANAVHPIAAVKIEVSPWSYEDETKKGQWPHV
jgi:pyridoxine 4-dehydrogenase